MNESEPNLKFLVKNPSLKRGTTNSESKRSKRSKPEKTSEIIKTNITDILSNSSAHGLNRIIKAKRILFKIMWLLFFICSASSGVYMVTNSILDYFKYEVVTQIRVVHETPTQFPTVTFYNLKNHNENASLSDVLISCSFNSQSCEATDFETKIDKAGNIYYQFNSGHKKYNDRNQIKSVMQPGKTYGFQVELFAGLPDPYIVSHGLSSSNLDGFHVTIHNYSIDPQYNGGVSNDGIDIPIGLETSIIVKRVFTSKLEEPYNKCIKELSIVNDYNSEIYEFMINSTNYTYRQKDCFDYCMGKKLIDYCRINTELDKFDNIFVAYINDEFELCKMEYTTLQFNHEFNINKICGQYCPLECDSVEYEITTTVSQYPNVPHAMSLLGETTALNKIIQSKYPPDYNITYEDLRNSMIAFNVFYKSLQYTSITEIPKTQRIDLVANIGGLLGLFIGVSFLSFGELIEIFFEVIFVLFERRASK